jgi:hypothetical protein
MTLTAPVYIAIETARALSRLVFAGISVQCCIEYKLDQEKLGDLQADNSHEALEVVLPPFAGDIGYHTLLFSGS